MIDVENSKEVNLPSKELTERKNAVNRNGNIRILEELCNNIGRKKKLSWKTVGRQMAWKEASRMPCSSLMPAEDGADLGDKGVITINSLSNHRVRELAFKRIETSRAKGKQKSARAALELCQTVPCASSVAHTIPIVKAKPPLFSDGTTDNQRLLRKLGDEAAIGDTELGKVAESITFWRLLQNEHKALIHNGDGIFGDENRLMTINNVRTAYVKADIDDWIEMNVPSERQKSVAEAVLGSLSRHVGKGTKRKAIDEGGYGFVRGLHQDAKRRIRMR